ncbi:N-acetyltransferase [Nonlabens sp. MB-3u-79]|jgi:ribosomal-protein-alanine N-acetyltransferase|uniref:GNAT family N-acetyltransferase n=1 Tax=Nonlabens sp. MB-3u-79 TaxID=2058134 RepID=UPI000C31AC92|nr:GNAT family N-acetyltransferase [Nonlabens sp. MB-3u-79]AUC78315.1 N-acetyltransferase [Nonlabens sp. MB-3u-79]
MILETERLYLRPFQEKDAPFLFDLNSDEEVMRYTGDHAFENLEAARTFAVDYVTNTQGQCVLYDMGRKAVIRKEDDVFLGWSGLKKHQEEGFVDIGYRFLKKYWGKGYATESGLEVLRHAFQDHGLNKIAAHVHELNYGSQVVAKKLGMQLEYRFLWDRREAARHYEITRKTYLNNSN